ncbi:hypothetical protein [Roseibium algae]|uniref:Capsular polysaccharide export protein n=1 Tax=Roseibium algae TaxID=3123038 RepID=A0ABU8TPS7_9HYPH
MSIAHVIIDPALKSFRSKFAALPFSGFIVGLDDGSFQKARRKALASNKSVTIILPGPLPMLQAGYPGSLIHVELTSNSLVSASGVEEAARHALLSQAETCQSRDREANAFDLQKWREQTPNPNFASGPDQVGTSSDEEVLLALFVGASLSDETSDVSGFWRMWATKASEAAGGLDAHLGHVLKRTCLWFDPYDGNAYAFEDMLETCRLIEAHWALNDVPSHCYGAQYWNHPSIRAAFAGGGGDVRFYESEEETLSAAKANGGRIVSWAGKTRAEFEAASQQAGVDLLRIEDGFLRSVGLGAGLARGASIAVDDIGIYYDPSRANRLEALLLAQDVSKTEAQRGAALIEAMVRARVSKYNFGKAQTYQFPNDREILLVPGQVADDAAVRKSRSSTIDCAHTPNVNLDLLRLARERAPDSYIVFKPHPDVETGLRKGKMDVAETLQYADEIAANADIIDLIEAIDRVETFSSLSGFEALIRGKSVTVHGLPFYAGWGLSEDLTDSPRRGRQRTVAELVYLAFCVYCRTIDPVSLLPCTPEFLIKRLSQQRQSRWHVLRATVLRQASWFGRKIGL